MSFSSFEKTILERIRNFEKLEKQFLKQNYEAKKPETADELNTFIEEAFKIAFQAFTLRNDILDMLQDTAELRLHDQNALKWLDDIRCGKSFYSISFYESMANYINAELGVGTDKIPVTVYDSMTGKFDDLFSDLHSWFDIISYHFSKVRIGSIVSSSKVPDRLIAYFNELKETYAFGQYRSSVALCRALLEMALHDKLNKKGAFKGRDPKVTQIDVAKEDNLNRFISMAKWERLLPATSCDIAHRVRIIANSVLHAKGVETRLSEKNAMDAVLCTIKVVEELYR